MRSLVRLLLVAAMVGGAALADDKVELKFNPEFKTGNVVRQVGETKVDQTLTLAGQDIDTKVESFTATRETVGEATSDGKTTLGGEFEYFIVDLQTPVGTFKFDSANASGKDQAQGPLAPLYDVFEATSKAKWIATLNSKPEIESIEFDGNPFEGLDPNAKSEITPERFKQEFNTQLQRYPDGPVAVGDTWKRTEESQIGSGQVLKYEKEFKYLGSETKDGKTFDRIDVKTLSVDYSIGAGSQLPLTLNSSDLKITSSEGLMLYDRNLKQVTAQNENVQIEGDLEFTIKLNGQEQKLPGKLKLNIVSKQTTEPNAK
ncbi:MAG: hypothetical protein U0992_01320 [Planctomycetaceae bacterium]